jgi:hypothetical protein
VLVLLALTVSHAMTASPAPASVVVPIAPERVLDTRNGIGTNGMTVAVGADATITLQVTGVGSVPARASGVVLTLTATQATSPTYITAFPSGTARSATSVLNVGPGADIANTVTLALGGAGALDLYNAVGSVHLVADVTGYLLGAEALLVPPPATAPPASTPAPAPASGTVRVAALGGMVRDGTTRAGPFGCSRMDAGGEIWYDVPIPDGTVATSMDVHHYDAAADRAVTATLLSSSWLDPDDPGAIAVAELRLPDTAARWVTTSVAARAVPPRQGAARVSLRVVFENSVQLMFCGADIHYVRA